MRKCVLAVNCGVIEKAIIVDLVLNTVSGINVVLPLNICIRHTLPNYK